MGGWESTKQMIQTIKWNSIIGITKAHLKKLQRLSIDLLDAHHPADVVTLLLQKAKTCKWSTIKTILGCYISVLKRACVGIPPEFRDFLRYANQNDWEDTAISRVKPATTEQVAMAAENLQVNKKCEAQLLLKLAWITAQRPRDILRVQPQNIFVDKKEHRLSMLFADGKGVRARQRPYAIHVRFAPMHLLTKQLQKSANNKFLFLQNHDKTMIEVRDAIKSVDNNLTIRSLRRGSLQTMAERGVEAATLLQLSGHSSEQMLSRYLAWGLKYEHGALQQIKASQLLN